MQTSHESTTTTRGGKKFRHLTGAGQKKEKAATGASHPVERFKASTDGEQAPVARTNELVFGVSNGDDGDIMAKPKRANADLKLENKRLLGMIEDRKAKAERAHERISKLECQVNAPKRHNNKEIKTPKSAIEERNRDVTAFEYQVEH